jgi:MerR family transcriptional regulator/heat shock protein HspR
VTRDPIAVETAGRIRAILDMNPPIYPRELVAEHLAVAPRVLLRIEQRGLLTAVRDESGEVGYGPAEIRRLWTILSLQRDLGVNLAGVEAILRLRAHVDRLHALIALAVQAAEADSTRHQAEEWRRAPEPIDTTEA